MTRSVALLAAAAIPAYSPAFYGLPQAVPAASLPSGVEASISVPSGPRPGGAEYAWLMAWSASRRHFTQIGWEWLPGASGPGPFLFSYTAWPGGQWTEPGATMAWSGRQRNGPQVHDSITVRIVPVSGTPADARRWYADQVLVGNHWVTMDSYPLTNASFFAAVESYRPPVRVACFRFASALPGGCWG